VFPTGTGQVTTIEHAPIEISQGTYEYATIQTKQTGYKVALGAAFRIAYAFSVGAGLIRTTERTQVIVTAPETEQDPLVDALYGGAWNQYAAGFRTELFQRAFVLAASYRTAVTKIYDANSNILYNVLKDGSEDYLPFDGVGYLPAVIGVGAEVRFGMVGLFFDYTREQWSAGRFIVRRGYFTDPPETDLLDTNNVSGGLKLWVAKKHMLEVAAGLYGSNIGDGLPPNTANATKAPGQAPAQAVAGAAGSKPLADDTDDGSIQGVSFGDLEAVPRTIFSGGYRAKITGNGYFQLGGHYQTGSRVVPEGYNGEGTYTLRVIMATLALAYGF
jgi:hypothetical protein